MEAAEIWSLLRRGGLIEADHASSLPKYSGLADPIGADKLGHELACVVDGQPSVVLVGESTEDAVLGHIVGRQLAVPVIRIYDEEGLAASAVAIPDGAQGLLVSDALRGHHLIDAAQALLKRAGGRLVSIAVLVGAHDDQQLSVPVKSLVQADQ